MKKLNRRMIRILEIILNTKLQSSESQEWRREGKRERMRERKACQNS